MEGTVLTSPVFVDASAWLARMNARDLYADAARRLIDGCFANDISLVTTNWTSYEALSMVKSRIGSEAASDLWALLTLSVSVEFAEVTPPIERRALELFFGYEDKSWGVVDCASLVVMEELGCRQVIAFDRHFVEASRQRGFEVLG